MQQSKLLLNSGFVYGLIGERDPRGFWLVYFSVAPSIKLVEMLSLVSL